MEWWNESYINRRDWILENYERLNLSPAEGLLILSIDFLNENNKELSIQSLSNRVHLDEKETDSLLSGLAAKGYLTVKQVNKRIRFSIDGIFADEKKETKDLASVFQLFEDEFGRLLNQNELRTLNEWLDEFTQDEIIFALRQASIYNKKSFNYIRSILTNVKKGKEHASI